VTAELCTLIRDFASCFSRGRAFHWYDHSFPLRFKAQKDMKPIVLTAVSIKQRDNTRFSVSVQSLPVSSNTLARGCVMLKIVYPICCGMDIHKSFLVACIAISLLKEAPGT